MWFLFRTTRKKGILPYFLSFFFSFFFFFFSSVVTWMFCGHWVCRSFPLVHLFLHCCCCLLPAFLPPILLHCIQVNQAATASTSSGIAETMRKRQRDPAEETAMVAYITLPLSFYPQTANSLTNPIHFIFMHFRFAYQTHWNQISIVEFNSQFLKVNQRIFKDFC